MRSQLHRLIVSTGLAAATLLGAAGSSSAQPRDRRHNPPDVDAAPREAPPAPRAEPHDARKVGFVWIGGRWDWNRRERRWDWLPGRWDRERRGKHWREGRWEQRDGVYVLVDGDWTDAAVSRFPVEAPPAPRPEPHDARKNGFVWAGGRWDWQNGSWTWLPGHWEHERVRMRWVDGRWKLYGDHWGWVEGGWIEETAPPAPAPPTPAPPPASGPTQAPPPPRAEGHGSPKDGYVWASGRWAWQTDRYEWLPGHWEHARPALTWVDGRWEQHGNVWVYLEGGWR
jgi:hypothetical protein